MTATALPLGKYRVGNQDTIADIDPPLAPRADGGIFVRPPRRRSRPAPFAGVHRYLVDAPPRPRGPKRGVRTTTVVRQA